MLTADTPDHTADQPAPPPGRRRIALPALTPRQVNLALGLVISGAVATGLASWSVGDRWNGWLTVAHSTLGLTLVLLLPAKIRGPVRTGFRRRRLARWVSAVFGLLVVAAVTLGILHATGLWFGVGYWSALWTHELLAFALLPLFAWHLVTRPVRPKARDLDRRAVLRLGATTAAALGLYVIQREGAKVVGLAGGSRRRTGSHEVGSHQPELLPTVIWLDDRRPRDTNPDNWELTVRGRPVAVADLWSRAQPVVATLDCTGGWWSEQTWDAVPLAELIDHPTGRSVRVRSATGYSRRFAADQLDSIYLAVGYSGQPLRPGHGAPVRLVVPGRRGPEWIKWVTSIDDDDRPAWLQPFLPLT